MAALDGAVPHPGRPGRSVLVGDDLDLHMARTLQQLLHENRGIAERLEGFGTSALQMRAGSWLAECTRRIP